MSDRDEVVAAVNRLFFLWAVMMVCLMMVVGGLFLQRSGNEAVTRYLTEVNAKLDTLHAELQSVGQSNP